MVTEMSGGIAEDSGARVAASEGHGQVCVVQATPGAPPRLCDVPRPAQKQPTEHR